MSDFKGEVVAKQLVMWIRNYFKENGQGCKAVIGISGGKDSSVVAAACAEALGKERVLGVLMPEGKQADIAYSYDLCSSLDIPYVVVDIKETVEAQMIQLKKAAKSLGFETVSDIARINTPARIRMTTLYGIAGMVHGRVANTCNLSEDWVGYATKFGDGAGDFSPLSQLTVQEVKAIGKALGLEEKFIDKTPIDGLCGKTDEENLGFTYEILDQYIREGMCEDLTIKQEIDKLHERNMHKLKPMPCFRIQ